MDTLIHQDGNNPEALGLVGNMPCKSALSEFFIQFIVSLITWSILSDRRNGVKLKNFLKTISNEIALQPVPPWLKVFFIWQESMLLLCSENQD